MRRILLVSLLPILALCWYIDGRDRDEAYWRPAHQAAMALPFESHYGAWSLGPTAWLAASRMHELINGRATYYEPFEPEGLFSGSWTNGADTWDMIAFAMQAPEGAVGAYKGEQAASARPLDDIMGYAGGGVVAFTADRYYIQLMMGATNQSLADGVVLAQAISQTLGGAQAAPDTHLPLEDKVPQTDGVAAENAFGYESLHHVEFARYRIAESETVWFALPGDQRVVDAYRQELITIGATDVFEEGATVGGAMFGSWEMLGVHSGRLWGVRDAPSRDVLMQHWQRLLERTGT